MIKKTKERLSKKARERYQNISEEEKSKKHQYARERYRNLSEEEKEKKRQYGRKRYKNLLKDEYRKKFSRTQAFYFFKLGMELAPSYCIFHYSNYIEYFVF